MYALFDTFLDICLLRKGPQDLPWSWNLLKITLIAYALASLLLLQVDINMAQADLGLGMALWMTLVDLGLLIGLSYGVMNMLGYTARFTQTLTALAGTGALLTLLALPVMVWMEREIAANGGGLPSLLFLGLLIWSFAVMTHIIHHALSVPRWIGLLYALGYLIASVVARGLMFPEF